MAEVPKSLSEIPERLLDAPDVFVDYGEHYECPCGCLKVDAPARGIGACVIHWCAGCGRQVEVAA